MSITTTAKNQCECLHLEDEHDDGEGDCCGDPPRYQASPRPCSVSGCDCANFWN